MDGPNNIYSGRVEISFRFQDSTAKPFEGICIRQRDRY
jgi:hypothetical protein